MYGYGRCMHAGWQVDLRLVPARGSGVSLWVCWFLGMGMGCGWDEMGLRLELGAKV